MTSDDDLLTEVLLSNVEKHVAFFSIENFHSIAFEMSDEENEVRVKKKDNFDFFHPRHMSFPINRMMNRWM